ncbi:MAG: carboxypeptidase-like regulatory domain-containing protein [Candidatus Wallbacteria bacterium]|nr:carboxypeptidase-like regulatory domain-containing protein [Candidatus Wallbacteria bacterium]
MTHLIDYLAVAVAITIILIFLLLATRMYRKRTCAKFYTNVRGRVVIKGKVDYSGVQITFGKLRNKDSVKVTPLLSKSGEIMRITTDKKGNFSFEGSPSGVHWIVAEAKGCKTVLKAVRLETSEENLIPDIVLK